MVCKILKKSRGIFGEIAISCEKFIFFVSKACNLSHNDVKIHLICKMREKKKERECGPFLCSIPSRSVGQCRRCLACC